MGLSLMRTHECFVINHKPYYRLTGLYYDLHDKQLSNQKAVDSSGSYIQSVGEAIDAFTSRCEGILSGRRE